MLHADISIPSGMPARCSPDACEATISPRSASRAAQNSQNGATIVLWKAATLQAPSAFTNTRMLNSVWGGSLWSSGRTMPLSSLVTCATATSGATNLTVTSKVLWVASFARVAKMAASCLSSAPAPFARSPRTVTKSASAVYIWLAAFASCLLKPSVISVMIPRISSSSLGTFWAILEVLTEMLNKAQISDSAHLSIWHIPTEKSSSVLA